MEQQLGSGSVSSGRRENVGAGRAAEDLLLSWTLSSRAPPWELCIGQLAFSHRYRHLQLQVAEGKCILTY